MFCTILFALLFIYLFYLFRKINYKIVKGPDSNIIRTQIYDFNNKYYTFTPEICICPLL